MSDGAMEQHVTSVKDVKRQVKAQLQAIVEASPHLTGEMEAVWSQVNLLAKVAQQAQAAASAAMVGMEEVEKQRDMIAQELSQLLGALSTGNFWDKSPRVRELMSTVYAKAHLEASQAQKEALAHDLADTLGDHWTMYSTKMLLVMLTSDNYELYEEGYKVPDVLEFRKKLHELLVEMDS